MAVADSRIAARSSSRAFGAGLALGLLGVACALVVVASTLTSWHLASAGGTHQVTLLGQRLAYPAANAGAIIVLVMALPALIALVLLVSSAAREALVAARLSRALRRGRVPSEDPELGDAFLLDGERPLAFCAGLFRPSVYVSAGAVSLLDPAALAVVLEHERHHARHRDPLRLALARVLSDALFFVPGLNALTRQHAALAELGADEAALRLSPASRPALARAILTFADAPGGAGIEGERIDQLLDPGVVGWRFPAALCAGAAAVVALLTAVAVLAGRAASGSATLAPPILSRQPCVLTLAALTTALFLAAAAAIRRGGRSSAGR
jgi:Zn-dependent protease with chaperone function